MTYLEENVPNSVKIATQIWWAKPPSIDTSQAVNEIEAIYSKSLEAFGKLGASIKFDFGDQHLVIDGSVSPAVVSRVDKVSDCVIKISPGDLLRIVHNDLTPEQAFREGRISIMGSVTIGQKFHLLRTDV